MSNEQEAHLSLRQRLGVAEREQVEDNLEALSAEEPKQLPNRAERRDGIRRLRALVRNPVGMKRLKHPLTKRLTPYGAKQIAKRRAAEAVAKHARQANR